jgi:hypothetical protein
MAFKDFVNSFVSKVANIYTSHQLVLFFVGMLPYWASSVSMMSRAFTLLVTLLQLIWKIIMLEMREVGNKV